MDTLSQKFLGMVVKEKITGFKGVVTGVVRYVTGCDQVLITPEGLDEKMQPYEPKWFDTSRIEILAKSPHTFAGEAIGPDKAAPVI